MKNETIVAAERVVMLLPDSAAFWRFYGERDAWAAEATAAEWFTRWVETPAGSEDARLLRAQGGAR